MIIEGTYKFENWKLEIVEPDLEILTDDISIFPSTMTIDVDIILTTPQMTYGYRLKDIKVDNLTFDGGTLYTKLMIRLKDFEV